MKLVPTTRSALATVMACGLSIVAGSNATKPSAFAKTLRICAVPRNGTADKLGYGVVKFANSCDAAVQQPINLEIAKLHSFEADPQVFVGIAARDPGCAIAWWGAAMSERGNPLGGSLDGSSLALGRQMVDRARAIKNVTPREKDLIAAIDLYYRTYADQITRARAYSEKMDAVRAEFPADPDIAAFDGLSIIEGVDLNDKTYSRQKRAGAILEAVMRAHPGHPGAPHYLIHAYDYTALAPMAVHAAEIYPTIATASSHANHMPSHIWSMLGHWDRSIAANRRSEFLADPSSMQSRVKGDIVFEHAFDFIAYARLQKGEDAYVAEDLAALRTPPLIVSARYPLERGDWAGAAAMRVPNESVFDEALGRFTRAYGAARRGDIKGATREIAALEALRKPVAENAGEYWGVFVDIYTKAARAWLLKADGRNQEALSLMRQAAVEDDGHEKHIYLENKIVPMRESLADMELALAQPALALDDYEASLKLAPNRYRSYLGAAKAAEMSGNKAEARVWQAKLASLARQGDHSRNDDLKADR